jgi:hypothetical protein
MYDLMEVETYKPKGDYKIDAGAFRDGGKDELIAALDAAETAERRKMLAKWRSITTALVKLVARTKPAPSAHARAPR